MLASLWPAVPLLLVLLLVYRQRRPTARVARRGECVFFDSSDGRRRPGLEDVEACLGRCSRAEWCWAVEWRRDEVSDGRECELVRSWPAGLHRAWSPVSHPRTTAICFARGFASAVPDLLANISAGAALDGRAGTGAADRVEWSDSALRLLAALGATLGDAVPDSAHLRRLEAKVLEESREELLKKIKELEKTIEELRAEHCRQLNSTGGDAWQCTEEEPPREDEGIFGLESLPVAEVCESWQLWVGVSSVLGVLAVSAAAFACVWCTFLSPRSAWKDIQSSFSRRGKSYASLCRNADEMQVMGRLLQREMRLHVLVPFLIPAVCFPWSTCSDGTPWWGYCLAGVILVRSRYYEYWILRKVTKSGWHAMFTIYFFTGVLDQVDWFMAGAFCVQSYKCEPDATEHFMDMIATTFFAPVLHRLRVLRFWWLVLASIVITMIVSQTMGSTGKGIGGLAAAAEAATFGAVSNHYSKLESDNDRGLLRVVTTFSKVVLNNACQLWLQSSFLGMVFDNVTLNGKAKLLLSMLCGIGCAVFKTRLAADVTCQQFTAALYYGRLDLAAVAMAIFLVQLAAGGVALLTAMKVWHSYDCPDHLWSVWHGCVHHLSKMV